MAKQIDFSIPSVIKDQVEISNVYRNYTAAGNPSSYGVDIALPELNLHRDIKSKDIHLIAGKVENALGTWATKYERHLEKLHKEARTSTVEEMNDDARVLLRKHEGILAHTLDVDDTVDWDSLKRKDAFRVRPDELGSQGDVSPNIEFNNFGRPTGFKATAQPVEPTLESTRSSFGLFTRLFGKKKIEAAHASNHEKWKDEIRAANEEDERRRNELERLVAVFQEKKGRFESEKEADNQAVEDLRARYEASDVAAIEDYCDLVLANSEYPDDFPQTWTLEYREEPKMVVVDYDLPDPAAMPTVESYRYIKARDEIVPKEMPQAAQKKLYNGVIYQVCIRTIHELFEADSVGAIASVAFNGVVSSVNPATGITETKVILSISSTKDEFEAFDLSRVDPKATFKHLKGVSAASLVDLAPVAPIIKLEKHDKRFVEGRDVVEGVDSSVNLASMDWEEFEHLVRELFEREFATGGGEVRVTQASSDGGVDAIAFDPDPIRGGKIVIQAKRYTNTVGVAAVRDLYGTVMNEGATKGILVTTSDYGKDSYNFAKDKPITLLSGANLLALLEKHGTRARINISEAKKAQKT